jgi:hypothetical protein
MIACRKIINFILTKLFSEIVSGSVSGSALVSMGIWIRLFISIRIRIQGAKPNADPDPVHQDNFLLENIFTVGNGSKNIPTKIQKPC